MKLTPVFDMRKLTDKELNRLQCIIEIFTKKFGTSDEPWWPQKYHMCKVTTMKRQGYSCDSAWIIYVPCSKVRKPSDNVKAYKKRTWTL